MLELDGLEFADNESRCPCLFLLDVSGSMIERPISELNGGLEAFKESLIKDSLAALRVEVSIVTFGSNVSIVQDFVTVDQFVPPVLSASGSTPMGEAINITLDKLEDRKRIYKDNGVSYYRPWVFLITDGEPTDEWETAAQRVQAAEDRKAVAFFTVGVEGANMQKLTQIAPSQRQPVKLKGLDFREMFVWLSQSLKDVSHSTIDEQVPLQPIGWGSP